MDSHNHRNPANFIKLREKEIRRWQDSFAAMAGVYLCCLDPEGEKITEFSGNLLEIPTIKRAVDDIHIKNIFQRVTEGELEDQAVERTSIPNLRVAAVAAKLDGKTQVVWIVCGILKDAEYEPELYTEEPITDFSYLTTEKKFYNSLDFLRVTSLALVRALKSEDVAAASTAESFKRSEDFKVSFHRAELMTEIVSLLDSDEEIEECACREYNGAAGKMYA